MNQGAFRERSPYSDLCAWSQLAAGRRALDVPEGIFSPSNVRLHSMKVQHMDGPAYTHGVICEPHHPPTRALWLPKLGRGL